MKVSVQFPLKVESENVLRSLPMVVANVAAKRGRGAAIGIAQSIANKVKKQRREIRMILDSQLPRLRRELVELGDEQAVTRPNFFRVTIIRISAGTLDTDGLAGALKHVRDEVAAWLGIDDSARSPASWRVGQQKGPPKGYAVRIEIEDDDPETREVHKIVGGPIAKLGPVVGDVLHAPRNVMCEHCDKPAPRGSICHGPNGERERVRGKAQQAPLVFRKSYFVAAEDGDKLTLEELIGPLFEAHEPPPRIRKSGRMLVRRQDHHPALGEHWIYEAAPSAARPTPREERSEARR